MQQICGELRNPQLSQTDGAQKSMITLVYHKKKPLSIASTKVLKRRYLNNWLRGSSVPIGNRSASNQAVPFWYSLKVEEYAEGINIFNCGESFPNYGIWLDRQLRPNQQFRPTKGLYTANP